MTRVGIRRGVKLRWALYLETDTLTQHIGLEFWKPIEFLRKKVGKAQSIFANVSPVGWIKGKYQVLMLSLVYLVINQTISI